MNRPSPPPDAVSSGNAISAAGQLGVLSPFHREISARAAVRASDAWIAMVDQLRQLQDAAAAGAPPPDVAREVTTLLAAARTLLAQYEVDDANQVFGRLMHVAGRAQTLSPPVVVRHCDANELVGTVTFGRFHVGLNNAVHGGAIALVFDEALGMLAHAGHTVPARTASLRVDYRGITPVGAELTVRVFREKAEGRKRQVRGTLHAADRLCAEASGLFVELRPGQQ